MKGFRWPRLTLVLPRSKVHRSSAISMSGAEHLGLGYIASYLRSMGVPVKLINFQLSSFFNAWDGLMDERRSYEIEDLAKEILAAPPEVVGICVTSMTLADAASMAKLVKQENPACIIGLGGPHAILCASEIMEQFKEIDFIGLNDGERSLAILLEKVGRGEWPRPIPEIIVRSVENQDTPINKRSQRLSRSIDDLPMPARDDLLKIVVRAPVNEARLSTSRGCNYQCSFCIDALRYNRTWYARSAEQVVDEIERLHRCLGIDHFWVSDDNFLTNSPQSRQRAEDIANGLIERDLDITYRARFRSDTFINDPELLTKLAQSGLTAAFIGLEAGSEAQLERFNKHTTVAQHKRIVTQLRENGVALQIGFIMFEPYATFGDVLASGQFLYEIDEMYVVGNFIQGLDLFPGAGIVEKMRQDGLIDPDFGAVSNYDAYRFKDPRIGQLAGYLERCHDEETITRDKWIYRYRANLLPRLYRKMRAEGIGDKNYMVKKWQEREQAIIKDINDVNYKFFKRVVTAAEQEQPDEVFEAARIQAWACQVQLCDQYSALYEEIKESPAPSGHHAVSPHPSESGMAQLPGEARRYLAHALKQVPGGPPAKMELLAGGNLNYMVKITNDTGSFIFRCRRPDYSEEINDYLRRLYGCTGFSEAGGNFRMRTVTEEVSFINRLQAAGLPAIPVIASDNEWMVSPFIEGETLSAALASGVPVVVALRFLYQLRQAHEKGIIYGDRWGANELVDTRGRFHFFDFDIELLTAGVDLEYLKGMEMGTAIFGCLLFTTYRDDLVNCMNYYGVPLLREWGYPLEGIGNALKGYRRFYLDPGKPTNPLSPPHETYAAAALHLGKLIDLFEGES